MFGLDCLGVGKSAVVKQLNADGSMRRRLLDIGLIENTVVECVGISPAGDPHAFLISTGAGGVLRINVNERS